jgi:hypothetical protein
MCFIGVALQTLRVVPGYDDCPRGVQFLIYFPVFAGISTLAALMLHFAVEKPFLILKDRGATLAKRQAVRV